MMKKIVLLMIIFNFSIRLFSSFEIGGRVYYFDYKEILPTPYKSHEYGWIPGVQATWRETYNTIEFQTKMSFARAYVTYDGTTQAGDPLQDKTHNTFWEGEGLLKILILDQPHFQWRIFGGLRYDRWDRDLDSPTVMPCFETYTWLHVPLGVDVQHQLSDEWTIGANMSILLMVGGDIVVDMPIALDKVKMHLGNKPGFEVQLPITHHMQSKILRITPWYRYTAIGESNVGILSCYDDSTEHIVQQAIHEPASRTHTVGISAGIEF